MKVLVVFYSLYGHVRALAEAVAEGARSVEGAEVVLRRVPETLTPEIIEKMGGSAAQKDMAGVPVCTLDELEAADVVFFGTPTRFGNMCGQMKQFLDSTGGLWMNGSLVGKVGSVFTSSNTQHGGQETTIVSTFLPLLHHGMVIVGLPYAFTGQMGTEEVKGCSPYGASTVAGSSGERTPSAVELEGARYQGRHATSIGAKLCR